MDGYLSERQLPDGRSVWLQRKIFTHAIVIGPTGASCYSDHWCYETRSLAEAALAAWDPMTTREPEGWIRHPQSGRRRPNGDKSKEYVNW